MGLSAEPALSAILTQAEALAGRRGEPLSTLHIVVALSTFSAEVAALLSERGLGPRRLLDSWERSPSPLGPENVAEFGEQARKVARRLGARVPSAAHALLFILNDSRCLAHRVLLEAGANIAALRGAVVQTLQGLPMRRREKFAAGNVGARVSGELVSPLGELGRLTSKVDRAKSAGQAVSVVPNVGPVPLPGRRGSVRTGKSLEEPAFGPCRDKRGEEGDLFSSRGASNEGERSPALVEGSSRFSLDPKRFPILNGVGRNLTHLAEQGRLERVVGRDEEVEQTLDVLAKNQANNPCLIGPGGVGKTSVVRALALQIAMRPSGGDKDDRILIEIPVGELIAGTGVRGALAGRLAALKKEVLASEGRVVLFFDEIHQLLLGDSTEELASDLKLALSRGELPCIGATSSEEYRRILDKDSALARRFTPVLVDEPSREEAFLMLRGACERLEAHHRVSYDVEAIALSIAWSLRYLPGRCLPDKALGILDLAGARAGRRGRSIVDSEAIAEVVAGQASMPVERLLEADSDRMLRLEETFCERVIGHESQMAKIARILRRNAAGLGSRRPIGTFLLLGPTGVGKTETAKAIAEIMFQNEGAMTRIDMAELSEAHAVAKLVGAPPGYVGHDAGGQLTEAVRRRPYQVVLLDEIEKAHPEVLTAFLAVLDEGRMTDSRGRLVDFTNTVIVMTSNLGAREAVASKERRVGFRALPEEEGTDNQAKVIEIARRVLAPELYNRLDEVLVFGALNRSSILRIGRKLVGELEREVFESRGIQLVVEDSALELLLDRGGYEPELGARPLRRQLARLVEAPLAEAILQAEVSSGDTFLVSTRNGELWLSTRGAVAAE